MMDLMSSFCDFLVSKRPFRVYVCVDYGWYVSNFDDILI